MAKMLETCSLPKPKFKPAVACGNHLAKMLETSSLPKPKFKPGIHLAKLRGCAAARLRGGCAAARLRG